ACSARVASRVPHTCWRTGSRPSRSAGCWPGRWTAGRSSTPSCGTRFGSRSPTAPPRSGSWPSRSPPRWTPGRSPAMIGWQPGWGADGHGPRRLATVLLAAFNILVGLVGGGGALWLALVMGTLSVHGEDGLPALGLAAACGLLGIAGVLLPFATPGRPRRAAA